MGVTIDICILGQFRYTLLIKDKSCLKPIYNIYSIHKEIIYINLHTCLK